MKQWCPLYVFLYSYNDQIYMFVKAIFNIIIVRKYIINQRSSFLCNSCGTINEMNEGISIHHIEKLLCGLKFFMF